MAKMKRGAKTQAVRDYISANPQAKPKEIVAGLISQGIKVKLSLANSVKYNKRPKGRSRRSHSAYSAARRTSLTGTTIDQLIEVKRLADSMGGLIAMRQAIDMLEQLQ